MSKLADRYLPDQHRVEPNAIYAHYQRVIDRALGYPGDFNAESVRCTQHSYRYLLTPDEEQFYEQLYVCFKPYPTGAGDARLLELFGNALEEGLVVGEYEKDIIDFLDASHQLLYLVAPVGWGKTVLLKYVWFYLINRSRVLSETVIPIYLSIDTRQAIYESLRSPTKIRRMLWEGHLKNRLVSVLRPFVSMDDEELWHYLIDESGNYADVGVFEEGLALIHPVGSEEYLRRRAENRIKCVKQDEEKFYLTVVKYLNRTKKVVFVFDNVDPLNARVHEALLNTAVEYTEDYGIRVIMSLRRSTFHDLASDPAGIIATFPHIVVHMNHKNFDEYISRRVALASDLIDQAPFTYIDIHGKRVNPGTGRTVIKNMLQYTLSQECQDALDLVAYHNLRKVVVLLKIYLSSGYIENSNLIWGVIESGTVDGPAAESPLWVLLTSILTANHATHFSTRCPNPRVLNSIVNLFCNSGRLHSQTVQENDHTIRFHVLSYFRRYTGASVRSLIDAYRRLFVRVPPGTNEAIYHAVWRLLQCDLIESPDHYNATRLKDCRELTRVEVTDKGDYFYERFTSYFEYLCYMKDDINIGGRMDLFRDCIQVTSRYDRYGEVYRFLRHVFEHEKEFFAGMNARRRALYREHFSDPAMGAFVVKRPVRQMVAFGKRFENQTHREKFQEFLVEIAQEEQRFEGRGR